MNIVILSGYVTKDPELKTVKDMVVANFGLAVYKTKDKTLFVHVVAYDTTAEYIKEKLHKGDKIEIVGYLDINTYKQEHRTINYSYVVCNRFEVQKYKQQQLTEEEPILEEEK